MIAALHVYSAFYPPYKSTILSGHNECKRFCGYFKLCQAYAKVTDFNRVRGLTGIPPP